MKNKVKVARCKNCGVPFHICSMPEAETRRGSIKQFRKEALAGFEIDIIDISEIREKGVCNTRDCMGKPQKLF